MRFLARPLILALLLPLLALATLGAAKCYPPDTRVVVFLQGLYSGYDAEGPVGVGVEEHTFETIKAEFRTQGYEDADLLDFSYTGGSVDSAGVWHPEPYGCAITDRSPDVNLVPLEQMLRDYRAHHPQAHFTLVGHSLGGYLAFLEGAREADRPDDQKLGVDGVVTLDAPLKGVSPDKKIVIDLFTPCPKTYQAGADLTEVRADPKTPEVRARQVAAMKEQGIRLATLGNNSDCLYNLPPCLGSGINDADTQFLEGAELSRAYEIHLNAFLSHFAILVHLTAVVDAVAFTGAP